MLHRLAPPLLAIALTGCGDRAVPEVQPPPIERPSSAADAESRASLPAQITPDNHSMVMDAILGKPRHAVGQIGILVYDGVNDLDFMGPRYVLGQTGANTRLIGLKPGPIKTVTGVQVVPDAVIDEVTRLDILIIPGGFTGTIEAAYDDRVLDWIRTIDKGTIYTGAICTGVWILGATGLLEGRQAVSHWYREEEFLRKYKAIPANKRYTHDGKYWTSAGVTAGMDMSLALLNDNWGERYTQGVMLDMEYDPAPPIQGGSPAKTSWLVEWMLKTMYDAGVDPLIDRLEKQRSDRAALK
ncbi:DJ-1/PfpI family protein [Methylibium petroleiphilum]|uniref:Transcriptional regulator n=1 Tax=Methylibium petroleiphilum (strain ATCC BAA-1232 / LMG 22953 / PM1) TaxID=420662 RepID=A2SDL2_METPP|nr:DJ-1/PfpI family protein [Methylibium petroleiphilum]ABM93651.1 transcriptional regulator [Methylibium petroleiphilum PM1]